MSDEGRVFTAFLIITSFGTFAYAVTSISQYVLDGEFNAYYKNYKVNAAIEKLENHVIVCGFGRNGKQAAHVFKKHNTRFVVVEQKKKMIRIQEHQIRSFLPEFQKITTRCILFPPKVLFFEGRDGLRHILDEVLKFRKSALCFLNLDDFLTGPLQIFRPLVDILFQSRVRCFIADSLFARDYVSRFDFPFCFMNDPGCQFFIFDHKIAIISSQFGFIMENKEISQFHRIIFDVLWKICTEKPDQ